MYVTKEEKTENELFDTLKKTLTRRMVLESNTKNAPETPYGFISDYIKDYFDVTLSQCDRLAKRLILALDLYKNYYVMYNIGRAKYVVNYHDGTMCHQDGSAFYHIHCTNNKKELAKYIKKLESYGYEERKYQTSYK